MIREKEIEEGLSLESTEAEFEKFFKDSPFIRFGEGSVVHTAMRGSFLGGFTLAMALMTDILSKIKD